jgi:hypothetical protein
MTARMQPWVEKLAVEHSDEELARFHAVLDAPVQASLPGLPPKETVAAQLRKAKAKADRDKWEVPFLIQLRALHIPEPIRNFRFSADHLGWDPDAKRSKGAPKFAEMLLRAGLKDWKMDVAWPEHLLAVEIEGAPGHGRHTSPAGFTADCVKYGEAMARGWTVLRVTGAQVKSGYAINLTYRICKVRGMILPSTSTTGGPSWPEAAR